MTQDEADLVPLQVEQHQLGKRNVTVQTEAVVNLEPDDVLPLQTPEAFSTIINVLKQLQTSHRELQKSQKATYRMVQTMSEELKTLKQSKRSSFGSLLNSTK